MLKRLSYIECPVCEKNIEQNRFLPGPKKSKWDLIQREIQCPLCKAELIMAKDSQKKLTLAMAIFFLCAPFFILGLADQLNMISIFSKAVTLIGIVFAAAVLSYFFYVLFNVRYVDKKESGS
jgi:hypothetical protein